MDSRERMLRAIAHENVDHVPCSFMIFFNLRRQCSSEEEFLARQIELGLDAVAHVGYLRPSLHPDARETVWSAREKGHMIFHRRIDTPAGSLHQRVRRIEGWPTADNFHMFDDYVVPRMEAPLIDPERDLEKLPYVLGPFREADIAALRQSAARAAVLAEEHRVLLAGGWQSSYDLRAGDDGVMGADAMAWLSGFVDVMVLAQSRPELIQEYMRLIHEWNLRQIQIYLEETKADLIVRRAWYETTDFWTPGGYRAIIAPALKREVELVHRAGRRFGLITTSAFIPLLDDIIAAGVDVLIGLDPAAYSDAELATVKKRMDAAGRAVWGGVSGTLVERGTAEQMRASVARALANLAPEGGFILSPVDNVREECPTAWTNTRALIEAWQRHRRPAA